MITATFARSMYDMGYLGEGYWRFSVTRPVQSATSGRGLIGGIRSPRCTIARKSSHECQATD